MKHVKLPGYVAMNDDMAVGLVTYRKDGYDPESVTLDCRRKNSCYPLLGIAPEAMVQLNFGNPTYSRKLSILTILCYAGQ
jgi:hypothetical protein